MKQWFKYWKTGWMFIAMLFIFNVLLGIIVVPIALLTPALGFAKTVRIAVNVLAWLTFAPLIGCWVLNTFDRPGKSKYSILTEQTPQ